jgi:hypothetical protein
MVTGVAQEHDYKIKYENPSSELTIVVHLVGGKLDLVLQNPALREVPFEAACSYAADNLDDISSVGDDLSCHEVSAKDDTGTTPEPKRLM